MSVNLINGDGVQAVYAAQDADWYAGLTGETTCILPVNDKLASELVDSNTLQISSGVVVSKEGRRIQINEGDIEEVVIPTGAQGVTNYYIVGFREYIDEQGTQMAEPFIESVESATATIAELTFKEGASEVYVSLYRLTQEGLVVTDISRICPYMSDMNEIADEIGDTDISAIGDGTITGAIGQINSDLSDTQKGKLRIASVRKTINLPSGYTTSVEVAIPAGFSAVVPLFARLSSTSKPLVVFNLYVYNGKFNVHFINAGSETITLTDALFEITYWGVE